MRLAVVHLRDMGYDAWPMSVVQESVQKFHGHTCAELRSEPHVVTFATSNELSVFPMKFHVPILVSETHVSGY